MCRKRLKRQGELIVGAIVEGTLSVVCSVLLDGFMGKVATSFSSPLLLRGSQ